MSHRCPVCSEAMTAIQTTARVRRQGREVSYQADGYRCDNSGCPSEDPPEFDRTDAQREANAQRAAAAWQSKFGEPLPDRKAAGRRSARPQTETVSFRLTPADRGLLEQIQEHRGDQRGRALTITELLTSLIREEGARLGGTGEPAAM